MTSLQIPVVDMTGFIHGDAAARCQVARRFGEAFERTGFCTIINHGVDDALVTSVYDSANAFFQFSREQKMAWASPDLKQRRGYLPMGVESVAATLHGETPPDLCEALVFVALQSERNGSGAGNFWPTQPASLTADINRYFDAMLALTRRLMRMSALALDLDEHHFDAGFEEPALTLRFVNYPDQEQAPQAGQLRYGAHHDYGGLTILRQDTAPGGLQICDQDGQWHDAPTTGKSFVINVGDLMARWTNDRWKSTLHRVINPSRALTGSTQRLSMVAFTGPRDDTTVDCLPSCWSDSQPKKYTPVSAGDYVRQKLLASMNLTPAKS